MEGFYAGGFALVLLLLPGRPAVRAARLLDVAGGEQGEQPRQATQQHHPIRAGVGKDSVLNEGTIGIVLLC